MREYAELDEMIVKWIGTKEMPADGFTKVLPGPVLACPAISFETSYNLGSFASCGGVLLHTPVQVWLLMRKLWPDAWEVQYWSAYALTK